MTQLNNIFIGNKVVKQAFLNDALIYQSNGWQTTENALQTEWIRSDITYSVEKISTDHDNNILVIGAIAGNWYVIKLNSDGTMLWRAPTTAKPTKLVVDKANNIYVAIAEYIYVYDKNGTLKKTVNIATFSKTSSDIKIADLAVDDTKVYILGNGNSYVVTMDNNGNCLNCYDISTYSAQGKVSSIAVDKVKYVYVGFNNAILRFPKNNFGNASVITCPSGGKILQVDSINNLYVLITYGAKIIKYKFEETNKPAWEKYANLNPSGSSSSDSGTDMILDTKDNVYVTWNNQYSVEEETVFNSDGTSKYSNLNTGGYVINGQAIATDELGNIYLSGLKYFDAANNDKVLKWSLTKLLQIVKNKGVSNGK